MKDLSKDIKTLALEIGFHAVGITSVSQPRKSEFLSLWLEKGYHGSMKWMKRYADIRQDILKLMPRARSVICVAQNYYTDHRHGSHPDSARISRYAWGKDYHKIMKKKLKSLLREIQRRDPEVEGRLTVDTAPVMEKLWAEQAGLGWQGKHTNLITRQYGSWVFLGVLVLNKKLIYDMPGQDMCGSCTACIDACPTHAIIKPHVLDARRCISYLTIEHWDQPIAEDLAPFMKNWVFGCDICQDVCPWNRFSKITDESAYQPLEQELDDISLSKLAQMNESEYKTRFKNSPVIRPGWNNFIRNINTVIAHKDKK